MLTLAYHIWRICLFKAGPQHLPHRVEVLAVVAVLAAVAITTNSLSMQDQAVVAGFGKAVFSLAVDALLLWVLLATFKKQDRFVKVATAWFGVHVVFQTFMALLGAIQGVELDATGPQDIATAVALFIPMAWFAAIMIYIIKQSLEFSVPAAILAFLCIAVIELFLVLNVFASVFPGNSIPASDLGT